jgi:hypothetical protein
MLDLEIPEQQEMVDQEEMAVVEVVEDLIIQEMWLVQLELAEI